MKFYFSSASRTLVVGGIDAAAQVARVIRERQTLFRVCCTPQIFLSYTAAYTLPSLHFKSCTDAAHSYTVSPAAAGAFLCWPRAVTHNRIRVHQFCTAARI